LSSGAQNGLHGHIRLDGARFHVDIQGPVVADTQPELLHRNSAKTGVGCRDAIDTDGQLGEDIRPARSRLPVRVTFEMLERTVTHWFRLGANCVSAAACFKSMI